MTKNVQRGRRALAGRQRVTARGCRFSAWGLYSEAGQRKYVNAAERERFIAAAQAAPPKVRTLCLTLAYAGCRLSEALALTGANIDVAGTLTIRTLKQRGKLAIRQVPVPPVLIAELAAVHPAGDGRLWSWGRTRAWQLVKGVMAAAGIRNLPASPKGLRHAFGVHAVLSGVPITLIQKWLGHASLATTAIYTDVLGPEERTVAARMW